MTAARIQLHRTKDWRKPEAAIVVSRPSIWGNPWQPGNPGSISTPRGKRTGFGDPTAYMAHGNTYVFPAHQAVDYFETWLLQELYHVPQGGNLLSRQIRTVQMSARRNLILSRLPELRGHDLCCWCKPGDPCHADVLIRMANG